MIQYKIVVCCYDKMWCVCGALVMSKQFTHDQRTTHTHTHTRTHTHTQSPTFYHNYIVLYHFNNS